MQRLKVLGLALVAVVAISAVAASAASAGPQWKVKGAVLGAATETKEVTAKATSNQLLKVTGLVNFTIVCKKLAVNAGAKIIGGNPGTSEETLVYSECEVEGKPKCEINGKTGESKEAKIDTKALKDKLLYGTKAAAEAKNAEVTDTLFEPKEGTSFVSIVLGANCPVKQTSNVEGKVLAKNLGTPAKEAKVHEIEALESGTGWEEGPKEVKVAKLKTFGAEAGNSGKAAIELTTLEEWSVA